MRSPVFLNWGRWVVQCPSNDCVAAEKLDAGATAVVCRCTDQQVCAHGPHCSTIIEPVWPANPDVIEATVAARRIEHRNWLPGETLDDLLAENAAHGVAG